MNPALIWDIVMAASTVRLYTGEFNLSECIIERHTGRTLTAMIWGAIEYHVRSEQLRIVRNLNSNKCIKMFGAWSFSAPRNPALQRIPGVYFNTTMFVHTLLRMVKLSFQPNRHIFFLGLRNLRMCRFLNMSGILLVCVSLLTPSL